MTRVAMLQIAHNAAMRDAVMAMEQKVVVVVVVVAVVVLVMPFFI